MWLFQENWASFPFQENRASFPDYISGYTSDIVFIVFISQEMKFEFEDGHNFELIKPHC